MLSGRMDAERRFRCLVRQEAVQQLERNAKEASRALRRKYGPLLRAEVARIRAAPDLVTSPRAKKMLIKMRTGIFHRRVALEVEARRLNEWDMRSMIREQTQKLLFRFKFEREKNASMAPQKAGNGLNVFNLTSIGGGGGEDNAAGGGGGTGVKRQRSMSKQGLFRN